MFEVVSTFVSGEVVEDASAEIPELVDRASGTIAEQLLELRERQFDGIQIGRIRRQVTDFSTHGGNRFADTCHLVTGEIIHHNDIAQ